MSHDRYSSHTILRFPYEKEEAEMVCHEGCSSGLGLNVGDDEVVSSLMTVGQGREDQSHPRMEGCFFLLVLVFNCGTDERSDWWMSRRANRCAKR